MTDGRYEQYVLNANPRPTTVLLQLGLNDLNSHISPARLVLTYQKVAADCRARGINFLVGTLIARAIPRPTDHSKAWINDKIRQLFGDHVMDFDAWLRRGTGPGQDLSQPAFHTDPDVLHPNTYGALRLATSVPINNVS